MKWLALSGLLMAGCSPDRATPSTPEPYVDALIGQLAEGTIEERDQAARALIDCGDRSESRLRAAMADANPRDRQLMNDILDRISVPKPLRRVLPPVRRVTILATNQSVWEVLEDFQRQTGTPMSLKGVVQAPISVVVNNMSPLEALDAICRAAKLDWAYPSLEVRSSRDPERLPPPGTALYQSPAIHFATGHYDDKPRLFIRHYEVDLEEIVLESEESRTEKRAVLNFGLHWPAGVNPHSVEFEVTSAIDDRGYELFRGHESWQPTRARKEPCWWVNPHRLYHRYRFRHPDEKNSKKLASIRGTARFSYLLGEKIVAFDKPEESVGVVKQVEGMTAEILEVTPVQSPRTNPCLLARVRIQGRKSATLPLVRIRRESGSLEWTSVMKGNGRPGEFVVDIYLLDQPSKVVGFEIVLESICAEDVVEFEFKDIPFPKK